MDVIVVDTAHGHSQSVLDRVRWVRKRFPNIQVIGGNIATAAAARALVDQGADAVKVGIGPGSICTTRMVAGVGVPQITAIKNVSDALAGTGVPLIADGGIRYSGDIAKAIAAGAQHPSCWAGCLQEPRNHRGKLSFFRDAPIKHTGAWARSPPCSKVRVTAIFSSPSQDTKKLVPEGVEGRVPFKGSVIAVIHQLIGGLRSGMGYLGCETIDEMHAKAEFIEITSAGIRESHVHNVQITKEAPNYHVE